MRIDRVTKRENITTEMVRERIVRQWTDEEKRNLATFELVNDNKKLIIPQILEIDKNLKTHGKIW
jgi:dephospho-CoA kinase